MQQNDLFTKIAQQHLGIETLETRNRDGLDFHDVAVWGVKAALEAAFAAGQNTANKQQQRKFRSGGSFMAAMNVSYADLVATFGEPQPGAENKTEAEWRILLPKKQEVRIYNYKNSKSYDPSYPDIKNVTRWHIGGVNTALVDRIIAMLNGKATLIGQ